MYQNFVLSIITDVLSLATKQCSHSISALMHWCFVLQLLMITLTLVCKCTSWFQSSTCQRNMFQCWCVSVPLGFSHQPVSVTCFNVVLQSGYFCFPKSRCSDNENVHYSLFFGIFAFQRVDVLTMKMYITVCFLVLVRFPHLKITLQLWFPCYLRWCRTQKLNKMFSLCKVYS